jgi:hypothetical protein
MTQILPRRRTYSSISDSTSISEVSNTTKSTSRGNVSLNLTHKNLVGGGEEIFKLYNLLEENDGSNSKIKSPVYKHSLRYVHRKGKILKCKYCTKSFDCTKSINSLLRHMTDKHESVFSETDKLKKQTTITDSFGQGTCVLTNESYRESLIKMCVQHDLPFSFVEWDGFRDHENLLNHNVGSKKIPQITRNTLKLELEKEYKTCKLALVEHLAAVPGKISLTADCWTSRNLIPFIGLTYHYMSSSWELKSNLLILEFIPGKHTGKMLAGVVLTVLDDFKLTDKLCGITTDNGSNNETMMREFEVLFHQKSLDNNTSDVFQPEWQWQR